MPNRAPIEQRSRASRRIAPSNNIPSGQDGASSLRPMNPAAGITRSWGASASTWVGSAVEALRRSPDDELALHEFADAIVAASDHRQIDSSLVGLVYRISGARKVELFRLAPTVSQRVACCSTPGDRAASRLAARDRAGDGERAEALEPADPTLSVPLRFGERWHGTLRLYPHPGQRWAPRLARRVSTLGVMAAAAESGLLAGDASPADTPPARPTHDPASLSTILPYALTQARRHREPMALLCIDLDRLDAIRTLHGAELARTVVDLAVGTIRGLVRTSDVIARLESDRLIVLLPDAGGDDALRIAESLRIAIAGVAAATRTHLALTASIGVASYPKHADEVDSLVSAAFTAAATARHEGRNRVVSAPVPGPSELA